MEAPSIHHLTAKRLQRHRTTVQTSGFTSDGLASSSSESLSFHELSTREDRRGENTRFQTPDKLKEGVVGFSKLANSVGQPNQSACKNEHEAYGGPSRSSHRVSV